MLYSTKKLAQGQLDRGKKIILRTYKHSLGFRLTLRKIRRPARRALVRRIDERRISAGIPQLRRSTSDIATEPKILTFWPSLKKGNKEETYLRLSNFQKPYKIIVNRDEIVWNEDLTRVVHGRLPRVFSVFSQRTTERGGVDTAEDEDEDVLIPNSKFTHRFSLFTFLYPPPYWLKMV